MYITWVLLFLSSVHINNAVPISGWSIPHLGISTEDGQTSNLQKLFLSRKSYKENLNQLFDRDQNLAIHSKNQTQVENSDSKTSEIITKIQDTSKISGTESSIKEDQAKVPDENSPSDISDKQILVKGSEKQQPEKDTSENEPAEVLKEQNISNNSEQQEPAKSSDEMRPAETLDEQKAGNISEQQEPSNTEMQTNESLKEQNVSNNSEQQQEPVKSSVEMQPVEVLEEQNISDNSQQQESAKTTDEMQPADMLEEQNVDDIFQQKVSDKNSDEKQPDEIPEDLTIMESFLTEDPAKVSDEKQIGTPEEQDITPLESLKDQTIPEISEENTTTENSDSQVLMEVSETKIFAQVPDHQAPAENSSTPMQQDDLKVPENKNQTQEISFPEIQNLIPEKVAEDQIQSSEGTQITVENFSDNKSISEISEDHTSESVSRDRVEAEDSEDQITTDGTIDKKIAEDAEPEEEYFYPEEELVEVPFYTDRELEEFFYLEQESALKADNEERDESSKLSEEGQQDSLARSEGRTDETKGEENENGKQDTNDETSPQNLVPDEEPWLDDGYLLQNLPGYVYSLSQLPDSDKESFLVNDEETSEAEVVTSVSPAEAEEVEGENSNTESTTENDSGTTEEPFTESSLNVNEITENTDGESDTLEVDSTTTEVFVYAPSPDEDGLEELSEASSKVTTEPSFSNLNQDEIILLEPQEASESSKDVTTISTDTVEETSEAIQKDSTESPFHMTDESLTSIKALLNTKDSSLSEEDYLTIATGIFFEEIGKRLSELGPFSFEDDKGNRYEFKGLGNIRISDIYVTEMPAMNRKMIKLKFAIGPVTTVSIHGGSLSSEEFTLDGKLEIRIREKDGEYFVYLNNFAFEDAEVAEFNLDKIPSKYSFVYDVITAYNDLRFDHTVEDEMKAILKRPEFYNLFSSYHRGPL